MREISPGVRELDHTADVGIAVRAASRAQLFRRAAAGAFALVYGDEPGTSASSPGRPVGEWRVSLEASDLPGLLVRWLRELLYIHETEGARYHDASFEELTDTRLDAHVHATGAPLPPVREIKGVTYHRLEVAHEPEGWSATVVFDV